MIRPITVICWILALGAGLYLYRAKHEVELMDRRIDQIAKATNDLRAESRRLLDDWIRLGEPEQLHKYSDQYLGLKTIDPMQFVRLADLPSRLPAPRVDPPEEIIEASTRPAAGAEIPAGPNAGAPTRPPGADQEETELADTEDLPLPPIPPAPAQLTSISLPGVTAPPLQVRPVTPRPAALQPDPATARPRWVGEPRIADEARPRQVKPASLAITEPRPSPPPVAESRPSPPVGPFVAQPLDPVRPPVQARGQGLPPLQAQGDAPTRSLGPPVLRPADPRMADPRMADPRMTEPRVAEIRAPYQRLADPRATGQRPEGRPEGRSEGRPVPFQSADPPASFVQRQPPAPGPAQPQGGSLLGMSRGVVPLPLPAPMPVSSNWYGAGQNGAGR